MNRKVLLLIGLAAAVFLVATGAVDLDWMLVAYKFDMWNGSNDVWEFAPYLKMNWHIAYVYTVARLVAGVGLLGFICGWLWRHLPAPSRAPD